MNHLDEIKHLLSEGHVQACESEIRAYVAAHPHDEQGALLCTQIFYELMQYAHALEWAQRIIIKHPNHLDALQLAVHCCAQLGLTQLGCALIRQFQQTASVELQTHCGGMYMELAEHKLGITAFEQSLACFPGDLKLQYLYGEALLASGDYERGMPLYGIEFSREYLRQNPNLYPAAQLDINKFWQGEDLTGKNFFIAIYGGVGDYIQFIRYAKTLKDLGAHRVLAYTPSARINGLLSSMPGIEVVNFFDPNQVDWWGHSHSLCFQLQPRVGFLAEPSYLSAPSSELADQFIVDMKRKADGKQCIALSWHSDSYGAGWRNVALPHLLPLFSLPNVHWVIVQRGMALQEFVRSGLSHNVSILTEQATFDDAAAVLNAVNAVVTIESFMYHIAGAIGQKTYLMAGRALDWRHMNEETHSVWYPSVQLIRQPCLGDWRAVIDDIRSRLSIL